jgi:hypothetical protein
LFDVAWVLEDLCFEWLDVSATAGLIARQNRKINALKIFALSIDNQSVEPIVPTISATVTPVSRESERYAQRSPFSTYQTHYGDGALVLLESLAQEGRFDAKAFGRSFIRAFRPGAYSGYIDRATRGTLENFEAFVKSNPGDEFDFNRGQTTIIWRPPVGWRH